MVRKNVRMGVSAGVLLMFVGVVVGLAIAWVFMIMRSASAPIVPIVAPTVPSTPIIVVRQESGQGQGPKMPVFPQRDPEYPLRGLSHVADFQQLGVLKSVDGSEPVALPLFGRRVPNRPDRWEYYTATDKQNMLRVPIVFENRDCSDDVGCNELYKNDQVTVPVYDKTFEVQLYKPRPS